MNTLSEIMSRKDVPVIAADSRGLITFVNDRFEAVWGWKTEDLVGKPLTMIVPKNLHDSHNLGFSRFLATGKPTILAQPLKLKLVKKDGGEAEAEHFIAAERRQGEWFFAATIRPLNG